MPDPILAHLGHAADNVCCALDVLDCAYLAHTRSRLRVVAVICGTAAHFESERSHREMCDEKYNIVPLACHSLLCTFAVFCVHLRTYAVTIALRCYDPLPRELRYFVCVFAHTR